VEHTVSVLHVSQRRACRALGQLRTSQRYISVPNPFREKLRERIIAIAKEYGRYGYKTVTSMLQMEGWEVGRDKVYSIWREEGLKVPQKQPKRARLWFTDGSCMRLRAERPNHVWSYDFVADTTREGRPFKILNIVDEYTRECLATHVARRVRSKDVVFVLADLILKRGVPTHIRSDNGPEFIAKHLCSWFKRIGVAPLYIEPGSPWENGYVESFNGKMRYQLLDGEIFYTLKEAQVIINKWREHFNKFRPHSSLGGRPPVPETLRLAS